MFNVGAKSLKLLDSFELVFLVSEEEVIVGLLGPLLSFPSATLPVTV